MSDSRLGINHRVIAPLNSSNPFLHIPYHFLTTTTMDTLQLLTRAASRANQTAVRNYRDHCTLDTCPITDGYFYYRPSLAANAVLLALFSLSLLGFLLQVGLSRRFIGFTIAMVSGCILEVIGYAGRIGGWKNPFSQVLFTLPLSNPHHI